MTRKLAPREPCPKCSELFVKGGSYTMHVKHCDGVKIPRRRSRYREIFFAHHGPGPYLCFFCSELVDFDSVIVHHEDHNHANNDLLNLKASHGPCHNKHHMDDMWSDENGRTSLLNREHVVRQPHTEETKEKIRKGHIEKGLRPTPEAIAKAAEVNTGKKRPEEVVAKMRAYASNRTPEHQERLRQSQIGRIFSDETRKKMSESAKRRRDREARDANN